MSTRQKRPLRPFQRRVLEFIKSGRNVILQAPTGAGKTDAALLPFIQNLEQNGNWLPHTCLYATPMRVLSNQFYEKFRKRIARIDDERGTHLTKPYEYLKREPVSIQTGEQSNDPQFESLLTFCTIDQLLASFLAVPYSMDSRRMNLNVGAVVGSYLVLDEFHLYPLLRDNESCYGARTTTLSMLSLLKSMTRFVLMTATFSSTLIKELAELLDAEVVTVTDEIELNLISEGRKRMFEVSSSEMSADTILKQHDKCSLIVCNTVLRAQQQYWGLKEYAEQRGIEVILLHSRLTDEHRATRSARIMHELGQAPKEWKGEERYGWKDGEYYGRNIIVVATQVVEVGLDISVQTLHTEIAPANSIIQRAGRCARFAGQQGRVIVYELPTDIEGKRVRALPYGEKLCDATLLALRMFEIQQPVGFKEEKALIDAVHTEEDKDLLARYKKQDRITKDIFTSFKENNRSVVTTLIRDVAQVQILIHDNPNEAIQVEPWRWQSFSLHPGSLAGRWQALQERAAELDLDWVCREAILSPESSNAEIDNRQKAQYTWEVIATSGKPEAIAARLRQSLMIVLPTQLATYHDELGFVLLDGRLDIKSTGYQSTLPPDKESPGKKKQQREAIKMESYQQHIGGLVKAYNTSIREHIQYTMQRLEMLMNLPEGAIDQAIRLAIACHDLGKLSERWQQWAWEWQRLSYQKKKWPLSKLPVSLFFYAKTDFDYSAEQWEWQKSMKLQRPNHACESVMLGMDIIAHSLGVTDPESKLVPLLLAVCGAIARHHTPQAHEYGDVRLAQGAKEAVRDALELARQNTSWMYDLSLLETSYIEQGNLAPENADAFITLPKMGRLHELETWLYFVIVRALRLADQRAGL